LSALDLGGVPGAGPNDRSERSAWIGAFDVVAMPAAVASWLAHGATHALFERLSAHRTRVLAITRGQQGYELLLRGAAGEVLSAASAAPDVKQVMDATGAGDALTAALLGGALRLGKTGAGEQQLYFCAGDRDLLMAELRDAPLSVLGGIGARAGFPENPNHTDWARRLAPLRGQPLDELKEQYGGVRPCWFCTAE
jgi:sugar/nucleoside kinase (ribokinase family)